MTKTQGGQRVALEACLQMIQNDIIDIFMTLLQMTIMIEINWLKDVHLPVYI